MVKKTEKLCMTDVWDQMNKLYGEDGLGKVEKVETLTSGSYLLDDSLGQNGLPRGRIIQYAGKESSGKTFMSLIAIKHWQELNPKNWALFFDAEFSFDITWAEKLGIDISRLSIIRENKGEKIFEKLCGVPHKESGKEKIKPGLLDIIIEKGGADESGLGIIVLDSIASIAPPLETSSISGKSNMALMGRFLPPELRKLIPLLGQSGVMFIAINQVRTDPGKMFGNPETTPGGAAWKHHCSVMIHFTKYDKKDSKIFDEASKELIGHTVGVRIDKNKIGPPGKTFDFDIEYIRGISSLHREITILAKKYGIVKCPNNKTHIYEDFKCFGKENFYEYLLKNEDLQKELLKKIVVARDSGVKPISINTEDDSEDDVLKSLDIIEKIKE